MTDEDTVQPVAVESQPRKKRARASEAVEQMPTLQAPLDLPALKAKIESVLFCIPQGTNVEAICAKVGSSPEMTKAALIELQKDYESRGGLKVVQDSINWKFKIPDENIQIVKDVAQPEMDKGILETLAYIAWRGGSRQCDVVRVRSNKAYNHIKYLIEQEYIESSRSGLSKWLAPTKKFYEYFNMKQGETLIAPNKKVSKSVEEGISAAMKAIFGED